MELDKSVGGLAGEGFEQSTLWRALGRSVEMTGNPWLGGGAAVIGFGGRGFERSTLRRVSGRSVRLTKRRLLRGF